jgi:hypothetical protein
MFRPHASHLAVHGLAMLSVIATTMLYAIVQPADADAHSHPIDSNALLVSNRSVLRVCLQTDASLSPRISDIVAQLSTALGKVRQHKDWEAAGLGANVPTPEIGCGAKIPAKRISRFELIGPGLTATPGPFRTIIVVLDGKQADTVLGKRPTQFATFESMRVNNHVAAEVTSALVVRQDFLNSSDFAEIYLPAAIGLAPLRAFPEPPGEGMIGSQN